MTHRRIRGFLRPVLARARVFGPDTQRALAGCLLLRKLDHAGDDGRRRVLGRTASALVLGEPLHFGHHLAGERFPKIPPDKRFFQLVFDARLVHCARLSSLHGFIEDIALLLHRRQADSQECSDIPFYLRKR